jgi:transmembrane sensor
VAKERSTGTAAAINAAAANWLLRADGSASAQLWEDLQQWLDADPRHRAAFVRLRCAWARTDKLRLLRPPDGRVDKDLLSKLIYEED